MAAKKKAAQKQSKSPSKREAKRESKRELQYTKIFFPHPLPYQGIYSEEDSLEQPSALKYVPSTTSPNAEA